MNKSSPILSYASVVIGVIVASVTLLVSSRLPAVTVYVVWIGGLIGGGAVVFFSRRLINRSNKNLPNLDDK